MNKSTRTVRTGLDERRDAVLNRARHHGYEGYGLLRPTLVIAATALAIGLVARVIDNEPEQEEQACVHVVKPEEDTLFEIAGGRSSLTNQLYEANGNSALIQPAQALQLGKTACEDLASLVRPTVPSTD